MENKLAFLIKKVDELRSAKTKVAQIEQELGSMVAVYGESALTSAASNGTSKGVHVSGPAPVRTGGTLLARLTAALVTHPNEAFAAPAIASMIGEEYRKSHSALLNRLVVHGKIIKAAPGKYQAKNIQVRGVKAKARTKRKAS